LFSVSEFKTGNVLTFANTAPIRAQSPGARRYACCSPQNKTCVDDILECLSSLENSQTRTRYINVASSYDGTFQWLFDREVVSFVDWLEEDQNVLGPSRPIFWINGKPGSGKSTLMKFAMRDERTRALLRKSFLPSGKSSETQLDWIILGFLFHDRGSHIQKSIEGMPQGVLHQLLSQVPDLLPFVYAIYDDLVKVQRKSKPAWTFESLCAAWKSVTQQQEVPLYACMFLDALDEHEGDNDQLSKFIYGLRSSADGKIVRIKICVASRTWNIFGEHFGTCPQFAIHEHTAADIQAYTSERLSCSMTSLGEDLQLALSLKIERLSLQVTTKARRVFIWVRIVLDELVKGIRDGTPISLLEEKVSAMPEELGDLYRHTLERIESDYAEEAYIMLQITLCSLSPLVLEAFMMCASLSKWGEAHHASEEEMVRQLISRSGGLLEIVLTSWPKETRQRNELSDDTESSPVETSPSVQFIHQTVKDFVTENHNDLGLHLEPTFKKESGYLYLLESGTSFGHTWPWAQDLGSSIFEYAFLAETEGSTDGARLYKAFSPMRISGIWGFESWIARVYPQYSSSLGQLNTDMRFLVLAAAAGLKSLVDYFLNTFLEVRTTDAQAMFLTIVATGKRLSTSSASRESMIKLLLKHGFCTTGSCPSLRSTHEIERVDTVLGVYSPLAWVLRQNFQEHISKEEGYSIAQLLLENGSDPNAEAVPDTYGAEKTSLLYSCIKHYDVEAVRLLLLYEAKTTDIDTLPLHFGFRIAEIVRKQKLMSSCSESMDSMGYGLPKTCIRLHFLLY
jgi:hypothetical protein